MKYIAKAVMLYGHLFVFVLELLMEMEMVLQMNVMTVII
jgi:hypothetical protein